MPNSAAAPPSQLVNGRFLMSKYSNDGHKLNHEILSPCTKEMVRVNLASPARSKCLLTWAPDETTYPAFCGDGVIQGRTALKVLELPEIAAIIVLIGAAIIGCSLTKLDSCSS